MSAFRRNPVFAVALGACALLVVAEGAMIGWRWWTARQLTKEIAELQQQYTALREVVPPPRREVADAIAADLSRAQEALAVMEAGLKGKAAAEKLRAAKPPAGRPESYFDLAQFVERLRDLAKKNDVDVKPDAARFGFAEHANEAPRDEKLLEPVFRQRQAAQYILEALLESRPRALLAVKREAPLTKEQRDQQAQAAQIAEANPGQPAAEEAPAPEGPDYFVISPHASVRRPGYVNATAFRVVFTGQTSALRNFLNRLGAFDLPVLVREVEVEPATADETMASSEEPGAGATDAAAAAPPTAPSVVLSAAAPEPKPAPKPAPRSATPIVAKAVSKFTVTLEHLELTTPPPPADGAAPAPTP